MPELPKTEWLYRDPIVVDTGNVVLLQGTGPSTDQKHGLRVVTSVPEKDQWIYSPDVADFLKREAENLSMMGAAGCSVPMFIGSGQVSGLGQLIKIVDRQGLSGIGNKAPFYARQWIDGERLDVSDALKSRRDDSYVRQALNFGERLERNDLHGKILPTRFVLTPDGKIVQVRNFYRFEQGSPSDRKGDLSSILEFVPGLPFVLSNSPEERRLAHARNYLLKDINKGNIQAFSDLRGPLLEMFQTYVEAMGYAKDSVTGNYRPRAEIPLRSSEAFGIRHDQQSEEKEYMRLVTDNVFRPIWNGRYSPIRQAREHPALAIGGLCALASELPLWVFNFSNYDKLGIGLIVSGLSSALTYAASDPVRKTTRLTANALKMMTSLAVALTGASILPLSQFGILPEYGRETRIRNTPAEIQQTPTKPSQSQIVNTPTPTRLPATFTPTSLPTPTSTPKSTPTADVKTYFGDQISGLSRQPKIGDRYTIRNVGYDKSGAPYFLLSSGDVNICVPWAGIGADQFNAVYNRLRGKEITLTRDPPREYKWGDTSCSVYAPDMITVGNQTLFEVLK